MSLRSSCRGYKLFCWFIGLNNSQQQQLSHSKPDVTMGDQSSYEMTQAVHNCSTGGNPASSGTVGVGGSGLGQPGNGDATAVKRRSTAGTLDNGDLGIPLPPPPLNVISTSAALIKRGEKSNLHVAIQNGQYFYLKRSKKKSHLNHIGISVKGMVKIKRKELMLIFCASDLHWKYFLHSEF